MDPLELLTYRELADLWSTTPEALRKRVERGELPVLRLGRTVRFPRHQLEQLVAEKTDEAWA